jgi:outer membrane protein assembly factor BamB
MHKGRWLQRMPGRFACHFVSRKLAQLFINQWKKLLSRLGIASLKGIQNAGNVVHFQLIGLSALEYMTLDRLIQSDLLWCYFTNSSLFSPVHHTPMFSRLSVGLGLLACTLTIFAAEDWPEFRGPTGQGISHAHNVPVTWSASNNIAWKTATLGSGWSSPVLHQGRLYITSAVENGQELSLRAQCYDGRTGKLVWDKEALKGSKGTIHKKNSQASPTPIVQDNRLYLHFGHHGTACLDLEGKVLWATQKLKYSPVHGNGGSPILVDDLLVFNADGGSDPFIAALSQKDGSVRWKVPRESNAQKKFSFSTPLLITVNGQKQIISEGSTVVSALDPKDGHEIWRVRFTEGYSVVPRPVFGHGMVFISSSFDNPVVIAIRADGKGDVTSSHVAWKLAKGAPNSPSLLLAGDELYMVSDNGIASCVDAKTGKVHWSERIGGGYSASPVFTEGRVYFQNEEGTGVVVKAGKQFEKLAQNSLGERTLASYAVTDGALFIRSDKHLYRIGTN